jgi:tetratricopeptide (TPR) repeat protein
MSKHPVNAAMAKKDWKRREKLSSALAQLLALALVLALLVFLFGRTVKQRHATALALEHARKLTAKGTDTALAEAAQKASDALAADDEAAELWAHRAWALTLLWFRGDGAKGESAKSALAAAQRFEAQSEERFAAEALQKLIERKASEAIVFLEGLRKKGASGSKLFFVLGQAYRQQGNLTLAKVALTVAAEEGWREPLYSTALGEALLAEGSERAQGAFQKALQHSSDFEPARLGLQLARVRAQNPIEVSPASPETQPPRLRALRLTVQAWSALGRRDDAQALTLSEEALQNDAKNGWALLARAHAKARTRPDEAAAEYRRLVEQQPTTPVFYFEAAARLGEMGRHQEALSLVELYEKTFQAIQNEDSKGNVVNALQNDDRFFVERGRLLAAVGKTEEALQSFDSALAVRGLEQAKAKFEKASVLLRRKDFESAEKLLREVSPGDGSGLFADAYSALGDLAFSKGQWSAGCEQHGFALSRMKAEQVSKERLSSAAAAVDAQLKRSGQRALSQTWQRAVLELTQ